jgi:sucrose-6-phosphate hydrolase SacC (GH32 family)
MVVYDETGGKQRNAIYTSPNLKEWTFRSAVDGFFECPELIELPIDGNPNETAWLMFGVNNQFLIGQFDGKTFTPEPGGSKSYGNYGNCFGAAQTFSNAPGGRRIEIGCERGELNNTSFWFKMSVPLELTLHRTADGPKLYSYPVRELERLRERRKNFPDILLSNNETIIPNMNAGSKDITVEFAISEGTSTVGIKVGDATLSFDAKANQLSCGDAKAPLKPVDGKVRLRVLADRGILEIFANDGLVYMPVAVPVSGADRGGVSVFATGQVVKANLFVYGMKSIWGK